MQLQQLWNHVAKVLHIDPVYVLVYMFHKIVMHVVFDLKSSISGISTT